MSFWFSVQCEGKVENAQFLMQRGADLNTRDSDNLTLLHAAAAASNNIKMIQFLLNEGIDINVKGCQDQSTPLIIAFQRSENMETVQFLKKHGADVQLRNNTDDTPLHYYLISDNGNVDCLRLLLKNGADINSLNNDGQTPLFMAVFYAKHAHVGIMLNHCDYIYCNQQLILTFSVPSYSRDDFVKSINLVVKHLIKLKLLNMFDPKILQFLESKVINYLEDLSEFESVCQVEANFLSSQFICDNRTVKFADLLTEDIRKAAIYFRVNEIERNLSEINFNKRFPIYSNILNFRTEKKKEMVKIVIRCL